MRGGGGYGGELIGGGVMIFDNNAPSTSRVVAFCAAACVCPSSALFILFSFLSFSPSIFYIFVLILCL
jgi:hypothetical protein